MARKGIQPLPLVVASVVFLIIAGVIVLPAVLSGTGGFLGWGENQLKNNPLNARDIPDTCTADGDSFECQTLPSCSASGGSEAEGLSDTCEASGEICCDLQSPPTGAATCNGNGVCDRGENCGIECESEIHCNDDVDNDGDGQIDEADSDCDGQVSDPDSPPSCTCALESSCSACESEEGFCGDNFDNDDDGAIDTDDSDCAAVAPGDGSWGDNVRIPGGDSKVYPASECDSTDTDVTLAIDEFSNFVELTPPGLREQVFTGDILDSMSYGELEIVDIQWTPGDDIEHMDVILSCDKPAEPVAASFDFTPGTPEAGEQISLDASASTPADGTLTYEWDLNDDGTYGDKTGQQITHSFPTEGTRIVSLQVSANGETDTYEQQISVVSGAASATALFIFWPETPQAGEQVTFSASASYPRDGSTSFEWDFNNDGNYGDKTGKEATHTFSSPGTKTVGLRFTADGSADTTTEQFEVIPAGTEPPIEGEQCKPLHISGAKSQKADILIVGADYSSEAELKKDIAYHVDWAGNSRGLFSLEPFKSNRDKFNVWYFNSASELDTNTHSDIRKSANDEFSKCPFSDYNGLFFPSSPMGPISIGDVAGMSWGSNLYIFLATGYRIGNNRPIIFVHEFGHAFANLKDEYVSESRGDNPEPGTNCVGTMQEAEETWGDLAKADSSVGFFEGCHYANDNWRPHKKAIMNTAPVWDANWWLDPARSYEYGGFNEKLLQEVLENYN